MMKWVVKAIVQGSISMLPNSVYLNYLFQRYVTKGIVLNEDKLVDKLQQIRKHIENLGNCGKTIESCNAVLELGSGRHPVIPVGLYACGFSKIWTIDVSRLMRPNEIKQTLKAFLEFHDKGSLKEILPWIRNENISKIKRILLFNRQLLDKFP